MKTDFYPELTDGGPTCRDKAQRAEDALRYYAGIIQCDEPVEYVIKDLLADILFLLASMGHQPACKADDLLNDAVAVYSDESRPEFHTGPEPLLKQEEPCDPGILYMFPDDSFPDQGPGDYEVVVARSETGRMTCVIRSASGTAEAVSSALARAHNHEFTRAPDARYEVESVTIIPHERTKPL